MFLLCQVLLVTFATVRASALWPNGTYGLIKATTGCPGGGVAWREGARKFDTEDSDPHNYFSANIWNILSGAFDANDITTEFCMKTTHVDDEMADEWPSGNYCILQYYDCPNGFQTGSIFWDGADWNNHNSASGVLPNGTYTSNTQIDFCCRKDGYPEDKIELPTTRPFVLFQYGDLCQQVADMTLSEAFVRWDDEDTLNTDAAYGAHPYDDGGSSDHKLHFCHYSTSLHVIG